MDYELLTVLKLLIQMHSGCFLSIPQLVRDGRLEVLVRMDAKLVAVRNVLQTDLTGAIWQVNNCV